MERKRKLPARAARVESVSKKRTSTPPEPRTKSPTPAQPQHVEMVEESLPKSVVPGKPLPTVDQPQPDNLSSKEFQSISESGVVRESLQRSKARWMSEGIFEKYWTKTTKRKGAPEILNNPPKDSMTKLGTCTITVEPHTFDCTMYAIKDQTPRPAPISTPTQPMYRPIIQYGPPNGMMPPPPPPTPPQVAQKPIAHPQPISQQSPKPQNTPLQNTISPAPPNPSTPGPQMSRVPNGHPPYPAPGNPTPNHHTMTTPAPAPAPAQSPAPAGKSTDPVIQMLAERAATDPSLKALMRIVANGEATPDELKRFQSHIDDLTRLQKARQAAAQSMQQTANQPPLPPIPSPHINGLNGRPVQSPALNSAAPIKSASIPPAPMPKPEPHYQPQSQALRSKGPLPNSKPDISGVVFEFHGTNGDRYSFPKFSILDYLPGGQVIASFLIVRKGSSSDSPTYDPELDYYQPITIRLYAHQGRQLEALQKIVAPPDEVRRYMDDIMDNVTRAEYVLLAMRLPKDQEKETAVEKEAEAEKPAEVDQVLWATTNSTPIAKVRSAKKVPTQEDSYHNFIASVS